MIEMPANYNRFKYDGTFEYLGQTERDLEDALNILWVCEDGTSIDGRQIIHGAKVYLRHVRLDALKRAKALKDAETSWRFRK
jgi:hypothetical protein